MTDDAAFIATIRAKPADRVARLVYADWLDERDDPRGQYLRTELDLAATRKRADGRPLRTRLQELRAKIDPAWLAAFDQPRMLLANPTPFPAAWWATDLFDRREVDGTYGRFAYRSVPPLPVEDLHGDYSWLKRPSAARRNTHLDDLADTAAELGLTVPADFVRLMESQPLQDRIRSCTDCFFNLPARIVDSPAGEGGYIVRFYSDSQSCLHWYLYLTPRGYHCVVVSGGYFGGDSQWEEDVELPDEPSGRFWFCSPSVETFAYRWWIENEIYFTLCDQPRKLTPTEEAYLNHYRKV